MLGKFLTLLGFQGGATRSLGLTNSVEVITSFHRNYMVVTFAQEICCVGSVHTVARVLDSYDLFASFHRDDMVVSFAHRISSSVVHTLDIVFL